MEIKIPKEVRQHKETIFFGLSAVSFSAPPSPWGWPWAYTWASAP